MFDEINAQRDSLNLYQIVDKPTVRPISSVLKDILTHVSIQIPVSSVANDKT